MIRQAMRKLSAMRQYLALPAEARAEARRDRRGGLGEDPGIDRAVTEALAWLGRAQDHSKSADGGVAHSYSLISGWAESYPETTGYIVPTLLDAADHRGDASLRERARRMLDWLVSIQLPDGSFQGGTISHKPVPTAFNTGQILFGLAAGAKAFSDGPYADAMRRAGDWLVAVQDPQGCWRKGGSPVTREGPKVYDTHIAWALLEAARVASDDRYARAALANVRWALTFQRPNGWLGECCLQDPANPLTHTLGYALRGVLEAHRYSGQADLLEAAIRTADGLISAISSNGFLPGRLSERWGMSVDYACLTGSVQIAHSWLMLHGLTGKQKYLDAARSANRYVRRTMRVDGPEATRGAIKGSLPVQGGYMSYRYPNWACKFFIDANLLEQSSLSGHTPAHSPARAERTP